MTPAGEAGRAGEAPGPAGEPRVHDLKVWPEFFPPLLTGGKPFEVRRADRDFRVGDTLRLREYDPARIRRVDTQAECYTGREVTRTITYRLDGPLFGIAADYCVLGLSEAASADATKETPALRAEVAALRVSAEQYVQLADETASLRSEVERLRVAQIESDAVIAGHWHSHRIDGSTWRLDDQAQPVQDAIRRYEERGGAAGWDRFCRQRADAANE